MKYILLSLLLYTTIQSCVSQKTASEIQTNYLSLVNQGLDALQSEKYDSCLINYRAAFEIRQTSAGSMLRAAACAYSVNDRRYMNELLDKAFAISWGNTKSHYDDLPEFDYLRDTDFDRLIHHKYKSSAILAGANIELIDEMRIIYDEWWKYRDEIYDLQQDSTVNAAKVDSLTSLQDALDTISLQRVINIIDEHGLPTRSLVGDALADAVLTILQSGTISLREKHLTDIIDAANKDELDWNRVAYYIDRLHESKGQKQIYGCALSRDSITNERYFYPIENPTKVDSLRKTIGLETIDEYAQRFNFNWDLKKHLERQAKNND